MNGGDVADLESETEMEPEVELAMIDEEVGECVARDVRGCVGTAWPWFCPSHVNTLAIQPSRSTLKLLKSVG